MFACACAAHARRCPLCGHSFAVIAILFTIPLSWHHVAMLVIDEAIGECTVTDVLRLIVKSDADFQQLFWSGLCRHWDSESESDNVAVAPAMTTARPVVRMPLAVVWDDYPDIDPYETSWIRDFSRRLGVLLDTTDYKLVDCFKLFFFQRPSLNWWLKRKIDMLTTIFFNKLMHFHQIHI